MAILIHIPNIKGDCKIDTYVKSDGTSDYFVADSFSFGIERELKESGEKGGTEDINIGIGELQEVSISKTMDRASADLAQFAINGNSCGTADIDFVEVGGGTLGKPICYMRYKLDRCFVKSWSTSGDADDRPGEEVAFLFNRMAFAYLTTTDGKEFKQGGNMSWDQVKNMPDWKGNKITLGVGKAGPEGSTA